METIEKLNFELKEKEKELDELRKDIFTYNPRIGEIVTEMELIKEKITKLEYENLLKEISTEDNND